ncbi:MAG TPA: serine hydrolase domain-containing protein [Allosphingosinicella sp.]|jgi:CubicO group peptidase (beta-lactamase class C family)
MTRLLALALWMASTSAAAQVAVGADTPGRTGAGTAYTQPKDFSLTTKGATAVFASPENDLRIVLVDVGAAADAREAATKAWAAYQPGFARKLLLVTPAAPKEGWDERANLSYETSPNEKMFIAAYALRKGDRWTVMLADGTEAATDKRGAAAYLLQQSLRPAGYQRESFDGKTAHRLDAARIKQITDFVAEALKVLEIPGAGVALIDGGRIVYQGGVGVTELGGSQPVTEHSRFMIASNTKGMATLLLSTLVDEGKLRWDQPVTEVYPSFRLGDDATTKATLVRHLVCACTGLPRKDLGWILSDPNVPATDTFKQLAATQPTSKFGELFQYNNLMASAAGYVGGALAYPGTEVGAAFDRAMAERIFKPLGMNDTTFDFSEAQTGAWARPHGLDIDGRMTRVAMTFNYAIRAHRPAGGAWSSAADMARYAQLELAKGVTPDGKRLVSEAALLERRKPGVPEGEDAWYGMGLSGQKIAGIDVVDHGGSMLGYKSNFFVLPKAGIGAVILTNAEEGGALLRPFLRRLLEIVYDGKPEAMADVRAAAVRYKAQMKTERDRLTLPGDPAVLGNLAPRYANAELGDMVIRRDGGQTWLKSGVIDTPLATRKNADGSLSLITIDPGVLGFEITTGSAGGKRTLTVRDSQHEYVYTEVS